MANFLFSVMIAVSTLLGVAFASAKEMTDPLALALKVKAGGQLRAKQLYVVEIRCRALGDLGGAVKKKLLLTRTETRSHTLLIANSQPSQVSGKNTLPEKPIYGGLIYAINGNERLDNRLSCGDHIFLSGNQKYYIVAANTYSTVNEPSVAINLLKNGIKVAQPLFTLFNLPQVASSLSPLLTATDAIESPYKELLTQLNKGDNITRSAPLSVGRYEISTSYSAITILVRPIASAVQDNYTSFTSKFEAQIAASKETLAGVTTKATCMSIASNLNEMGFLSPSDQGYILVRLAYRGGVPREDLLNNCLSVTPALAAARLGEFYWKGMEDYRFSEVDVRNVFGAATAPGTVPISFNSAVPIVSKLMRVANQILRVSPAPESALKALPNIFNDQIIFEDGTDDMSFGSFESISASAAIRLLKDKGVTRTGCYVQASGDTDAASDGAVILFLGFLVELGAKEALAEQAIAIRPQFSGGRISALAISRNSAWIKSVLGNRDACGELRIKKAA